MNAQRYVFLQIQTCRNSYFYAQIIHQEFTFRGSTQTGNAVCERPFADTTSYYFSRPQVGQKFFDRNNLHTVFPSSIHIVRNNNKPCVLIVFTE